MRARRGNPHHALDARFFRRKWRRHSLRGHQVAPGKSARRVSPLYLDERGMPLSVATGGMYLQPTEERRRSGSHYTPRSLTEPIVRTALEPILKQLGEKPRPEQILNLKICDPAMGSGAFLVEACRF